MSFHPVLQQLMECDQDVLYVIEAAMLEYGEAGGISHDLRPPARHPEDPGE